MVLILFIYELHSHLVSKYIWANDYFLRAEVHNSVLDLAPDHQKIMLCLVFSDL